MLVTARPVEGSHDGQEMSGQRTFSSVSIACNAKGGLKMWRAPKAGLITITLTAGCLFWILASTQRASAIPAFSRKYQTSCATCHTAFPELNDFGEAFKRNGFKFPKDDDAFVKEPPVLLGAKAQKEAFPGAIYPGEIPGSIP